MDAIVELINKNPYLVIVTFSISFLANFIQIFTYFRDRARIKEEKEESERLFSELQKYKYVVGLAERNIKTEEALREVEEDIAERQNTAAEIEKRMQQMQLAAQHKVVQNAIDRSLADLLSAYEDVKALRAKHQAMGPLPEIPEVAKAEIEREVTISLRKPYELPKAFIFRALLLLLFIFLLPRPVDSFITLIFLHVFLALFFEAAEMYSDGKVSEWVRRHADSIGNLSAIGVWYILLNFLQSLLLRPLLSFGLWEAVETLIPLSSFLAGILHWRAIRDKALPKLPPSASSAPATAID